LFAYSKGEGSDHSAIGCKREERKRENRRGKRKGTGDTHAYFPPKVPIPPRGEKK